MIFRWWSQFSAGSGLLHFLLFRNLFLEGFRVRLLTFGRVALRFFPFSRVTIGRPLTIDFTLVPAGHGCSHFTYAFFFLHCSPTYTRTVVDGGYGGSEV